MGARVPLRVRPDSNTVVRHAYWSISGTVRNAARHVPRAALDESAECCALSTARYVDSRPASTTVNSRRVRGASARRASMPRISPGSAATPGDSSRRSTSVSTPRGEKSAYLHIPPSSFSAPRQLSRHPTDASKRECDPATYRVEGILDDIPENQGRLSLWARGDRKIE